MKTTIEISDDRLSDLLCNAFEGGVGYWLQIQGYKMPKTKPVLKDPYWEARHIWVPLSEGGAMLCGEDSEGDGTFSTKHELNKDKLFYGLGIMAAKYPKHYANIISENDDATTADVLIQCALLGEIIYG